MRKWKKISVTVQDGDKRRPISGCGSGSRVEPSSGDDLVKVQPRKRSTVASYRRRYELADEVPGLSIRRLTLEDPRSARESHGSRSNSPDRHTCHPRSSSTPTRRNTSSYRSWLERMRKERPPFLTIVSLELPESPVPLIVSQETTRTRPNSSKEFVNDKDEILDELLQKVSDVTKQAKRRERRDQSAESRLSKSAKVSRRERLGTECTKNLRTLEECTRSITYEFLRGHDEEGRVLGQPPNEWAEKDADGEPLDECICSEIPANLRINVGKKSEVGATASPEVTHTIRIAMKYHGQRRCKLQGEEELREEEEGNRVGNNRSSGASARKSSEDLKEEGGSCSGVNVALDLMLNCSSVRLTSRDVSLRTGLRRPDNSVG